MEIRTFTCITMFLFSTGALLNAQEANLTPEQQREYNSKKTTVEAFGQGFGGISSIGTINVSTWTSWKAYQGFNQISEAYFFNLAGYPNEAQNAQTFHTIGFVLRISGFSLMGIGAIVSLGIGLPEDEEEFIFGGLGAVVVGAIPTVLGMLRLNQNRYPYATASDVAEEYNAFLVRDIKQK